MEQPASNPSATLATPGFFTLFTSIFIANMTFPILKMVYDLATIFLLGASLAFQSVSVLLSFDAVVVGFYRVLARYTSIFFSSAMGFTSDIILRKSVGSAITGFVLNILWVNLTYKLKESWNYSRNLLFPTLLGQIIVVYFAERLKLYKDNYSKVMLILSYFSILAWVSRIVYLSDDYTRIGTFLLFRSSFDTLYEYAYLIYNVIRIRDLSTPRNEIELIVRMSKYVLWTSLHLILLSTKLSFLCRAMYLGMLMHELTRLAIPTGQYISMVLYNRYITRHFPPLSGAELLALGDDDNCSVCLCQHDNSSVRLQCNHILHKDCLKRLLQQSRASSSQMRRCPICRADIIRQQPSNNEADQSANAAANTSTTTTTTPYDANLNIILAALNAIGSEDNVLLVASNNNANIGVSIRSSPSLLSSSASARRRITSRRNSFTNIVGRNSSSNNTSSSISDILRRRSSISFPFLFSNDNNSINNHPSEHINRDYWEDDDDDNNNLYHHQHFTPPPAGAAVTASSPFSSDAASTSNSSSNGRRIRIHFLTTATSSSSSTAGAAVDDANSTVLHPPPPSPHLNEVNQLNNINNSNNSNLCDNNISLSNRNSSSNNVAFAQPPPTSPAVQQQPRRSRVTFSLRAPLHHSDLETADTNIVRESGVDDSNSSSGYVIINLSNSNINSRSTLDSLSLAELIAANRLFVNNSSNTNETSSDNYSVSTTSSISATDSDITISSTDAAAASNITPTPILSTNNELTSTGQLPVAVVSVVDVSTANVEQQEQEQQTVDCIEGKKTVIDTITCKQSSNDNDINDNISLSTAPQSAAVVDCDSHHSDEHIVGHKRKREDDPANKTDLKKREL